MTCDTAARALQEAPSALVERLVVDEPDRGAAAEDFGGLVHRQPMAVLRPRSVSEISQAVRWAASAGIPVAAQGTRHSVWGRGQARDGLVIDLGSFREVTLVSDDLARVGAGATWRDVLSVTLPHHLTPPVLPIYLDISVGGTVCVGGVGETSWRLGVVSDHVRELDVVTGAGEFVSCSRTQRRDLFDAVRAGLGQVAVITGATISLVPAPDQVRRFQLFYPDLAAMLADVRLLDAEDRFDAVQTAVTAAPDQSWSFRIDATQIRSAAEQPTDAELLQGLSDIPQHRDASTVGYRDHLDRLAGLESMLRSNGQWSLPHPWLATFVGDAVVGRLVGDELARLEPSDDLGPFGQVTVSPVRRRAITTPLLQVPDEPLIYAFNLLRFPATDDDHRIGRLVQANEAIYRRVRENAGTLYPVSAFPMRADDWRRHFGTEFSDLEAAKRRYDPAGLLTPGYEVFMSRGG